MQKRMYSKSRFFIIVAITILMALFMFKNVAYADIIGGPGITGVDIDSVENETTRGEGGITLKIGESAEIAHSDIFKYVIAISGGLLLLIVVLVTKPHTEKTEMAPQVAFGSQASSNEGANSNEVVNDNEVVDGNESVNDNK